MVDGRNGPVHLRLPSDGNRLLFELDGIFHLGRTKRYKIHGFFLICCFQVGATWGATWGCSKEDVARAEAFKRF